MIKTSKTSFSHITLTFSDLSFPQCAWSISFSLGDTSLYEALTQPLSCPALFNLKSDREELQGKASRKSDINQIAF